MHLQEIDLANFSADSVEPGKHLFRLQLFYFRDGTRLSVPAAVIKGSSSGPSVCVIATQHGDEWNGAYIIHHLFNEIEASDVSGSLVFLPIANPPAFIEKNRTSRVDGVDMNRVYHFFKGHRPTEQLAKYLFDQIFRRSDYLIDLHSGGPGEYLPNVGALRSRRELAESLGFGHVLLAKEEPGGFVRNAGALAPALEAEGVPALVVEIGRGRSIQRRYCRQGITGLMNLFRSVGALSGEADTFPAQSLYQEKAAVKSPIPGIFEPIAELGEHVSEGQLIGRVTAILAEEAFEAFAPASGTVLYIRREEMVAEGESLYHIAWAAK